jgi:hypothetical protein
MWPQCLNCYTIHTFNKLLLSLDFLGRFIPHYIEKARTFTLYLTNSMKQSPSEETESRSADEEIPCHL